MQVGVSDARADGEFSGAGRGGHLVEPGADAALLEDEAGDDADAVPQSDQGEQGFICGATAGVGCVVAGAVVGELGGASGASIGSARGGGSTADRKDAFYGGFLGAGIGPLKWGFGRYLP